MACGGLWEPLGSTFHNFASDIPALLRAVRPTLVPPVGVALPNRHAIRQADTLATHCHLQTMRSQWVTERGLIVGQQAGALWSGLRAVWETKRGHKIGC